MKNIKPQNIAILFLVMAALFIIVVGSIFKKALIKNHKESVAKITEGSYGGRGHSGTISLIFKFNVEGREIEGNAAFNSSELYYSDVEKFIVGKTFPVVYNPNSPHSNHLLIRKKDFEQFNVPFPDSMKWVLQYFKKED